MPQAAEDLAEDMVFRFLDEEDVLISFQRRAIQAAGRIQAGRKSALNSSISAERQRMIKLNSEVLDFYRKKMSPIYMAGARSINPTHQFTAVDNKVLARITLDQYGKLRDTIQQVPLETRRFLEMIRNDTTPRRKELGTKHPYVETHPEMTIRKRGIKPTAYKDGKRMTLGDYGSMSMRTTANRAYNTGAAQAAKRLGMQFLSVSDGPGCGWTFHADPETANGKVVTIDEAQAYPLAHPNCQRSFSPATREQERKERERRELRRKAQHRKVAKAAAIGIGGALGAIEATNLLAAGAQAIARSEFLDQAIERMAQRAFQGSLTARRMVERLSALQDAFSTQVRQLATVVQLHPPTGAFPIETAQKFIAPLYPGNLAPAIKNIPEVWKDVKVFGDGFIEGLGVKEIPSAVKRAIGAAADATADKLGSRFKAFYETIKSAAFTEDNVENVKRVIDFEARRRGMFYRVLDRLPGAPVVRATWSKWGPRTRIDLTSFLRGRITATPTGMIKSLTTNATGAVKGVLKMYQDGTIGGHISVIPKRFLQGIVRGIVEVDEDGRLVGNIRLVPGGPLRLRLEFATGSERTDLRDFLISPLGALGDLGTRFRKFAFKRAVVELKIFNQSVFDISASLRLPIPEVRERIRTIITLGRAGELHRNYNGTFTGTFSYFIHEPGAIKELFKGVKATIFGNIRFSSITSEQAEANVFFRALRRGNVRLLNAAHLTHTGLQDIATNMRIHGWHIYDIASVLRLRWQDSRQLVWNGLYRLQRFAQDLGVMAVEDLLPTWEVRLKGVVTSYRKSSRYRGVNAADALHYSLEAVNSGAANVQKIQVRNMLSLLGSKFGDNREQVYNKLRNLIEFLKANEGLDSQVIRDQLARLDPSKLRAFAQEISETIEPKLRVVRGVRELPLPRRPGPGGVAPAPVFTNATEGVMKVQGGSRYGDWLYRQGPIRGSEIFKRGIVEVEEHEVFLERADGTVRRVLVPAIRMDYADYKNFMEDLLDLDPKFLEDLLTEYDFMAQRYGPGVDRRKLAQIVFEDVTENSPHFLSPDTIVIPLLEETEMLFTTGKKLSAWVGEDYSEYFINDEIRREIAGEVVGRINPTYVHEFTHFLHQDMVDTPAGRAYLRRTMDDMGELTTMKVLGEETDVTLQESLDIMLDTFTGTAEPLDGLEELLWTPLDQTFGENFRDIVQAELGIYATKDWWEFFAEAMRHYLTDENPGELATIVGHAFDAYYGVP